MLIPVNTKFLKSNFINKQHLLNYKINFPSVYTGTGNRTLRNRTLIGQCLVCSESDCYMFIVTCLSVGRLLSDALKYLQQVVQAWRARTVIVVAVACRKRWVLVMRSQHHHHPVLKTRFVNKRGLSWFLWSTHTLDPRHFGTSAELSVKHFDTSAELSRHIGTSAKVSVLWTLQHQEDT